jgi:hypothetical protein
VPASARARGCATANGRTLASARFCFTLVPPHRLIPDAYQVLWRQMIDTWLGRYPGLGDD